MQKIEILRKILRILRKIAKKVHAACFLGFYVKSQGFDVKSEFLSHVYTKTSSINYDHLKPNYNDSKNVDIKEETYDNESARKACKDG